MNSRYKMILKGLVLSTALGLTPAFAQEQDAVTIDVLLELVANDAAGDVLNLSSAELAAILETATDEQLTQLVATLSPAQADALVAAVAQSGAEPSTIAAVVTAVITADPSAAARVIEVVRQNAAPDSVQQIANAMVDQIERRFNEVPPAVSSALVPAALALDARAANQLVQVINRLDATTAAALSMTLATASTTADPATVSAIETALAIQGGPAAQLLSAARNEIAPAPTPVPVAEAPPAPVAPVPIGGAGATPAGTAASSAGGQTQVASSAPSPGSGGVPPGPSVSAPSTPPLTTTPPAPAPVVSPTN